MQLQYSLQKQMEVPPQGFLEWLNQKQIRLFTPKKKKT